jgi:SAM-dependent methyltransferase
MSDLVRAMFVLRRAASIGLIHQPTLPENMETLPSTNHFDAISGTWDCDPVKRARALAIAEGIRSEVPLAPQMQALEYGCGTGLVSFALQSELGHIALADSSAGMLSVLEEKVAANGFTNMHPRKLDLVADPLPVERYDLIYTAMTCHHIRDTSGLLRILYSLLASAGYLCIADLDAEDGSFHGPGFDGHNGFDRDALGAMAEAVGFREIRFTTVFRMTKGDGPEPAEYPVFLMVARK